MDGTRRDALAWVGGAMAAGLTAGAAGTAAAANLGSPVKTLFWTAAATPCDKYLAFDAGAFRDELAWFKHCGADGVVVLGTSGEFPSFSVAERRRIAEVALKDKMGLNVIIGPGTSNFPETLELSRHAQDNGADGLLVIPPFYYNAPSTEGLTRYYSMLFDQVSIPINLYHIPDTSEVPISLELLGNLKHYPNLAGIKDSSGNSAGYAAFVAAFPDLNMRTGTLNNLEPALDHGMGAILQDGNVFTSLCAEVFKAYRGGQDWRAALARVRAAQQLFKDADIWSFGPMKYALSVEMGGAPSYQRPPHADVTEAQKAAIKTALAKMKDLA